MRQFAILGSILAALALVPAPATVAAHEPVYDGAFWKIWGDGQAELSGYELTFPRYGHLRRGVAVTVFVTEEFSNSLRVKADPGKHPAGDRFPAMKLNLVKDFQTGIYDYNTMTSSFAALAAVNGRPAGTATKVAFSSQEWCGQTYQQLLFDANGIRSSSHSYFDGEGDQQTALSYPAGGMSEDELLLWARGMAGPQVARGEQHEVELLVSLETARLEHVPVVWRKAVLERAAAPQKVTVPAGTFQAEKWTAAAKGGLTRSIYVETAAPHRIVRWETSAGERARNSRSRTG